MYAIWTGNLDTVQILISNGAELNAKDQDGITPLMWASSYGYSDIVKMLIVNGADVNAIDNNGETPLYYAVYNNYEDGVKVLLANGASADSNFKCNTCILEEFLWRSVSERLSRSVVKFLDNRVELFLGEVLKTGAFR